MSMAAVPGKKRMVRLGGMTGFSTSIRLSFSGAGGSVFNPFVSEAFSASELFVLSASEDALGGTVSSNTSCSSVWWTDMIWPVINMTIPNTVMETTMAR